MTIKDIVDAAVKDAWRVAAKKGFATSIAEQTGEFITQLRRITNTARSNSFLDDRSYQRLISVCNSSFWAAPGVPSKYMHDTAFSPLTDAEQFMHINQAIGTVNRTAEEVSGMVTRGRAIIEQFNKVMEELNG